MIQIPPSTKNITEILTSFHTWQGLLGLFSTLFFGKEISLIQWDFLILHMSKFQLLFSWLWFLAVLSILLMVQILEFKLETALCSLQLFLKLSSLYKHLF